MRSHQFDVVATGLDHQAEDFEDRFYRSGMDDTLVCVRGGLIHICFDRPGDDPEAVVEEAVRQVSSVGANVVRVDR